MLHKILAILVTGLMSVPAYGAVPLNDLLADAQFHSNQSTTDVDLAILKSTNGWSFDTDLEAAWGIGDSSTVQVSFSSARQTLVLTGKPFLYRGSEVQWVDVSLNQHLLRRIRLTPWTRTYRVRIPRQLTEDAGGQLAFQYRWAKPPSKTLSSSTDNRDLAAQWKAIGLHEGRRSKGGFEWVNDDLELVGSQQLWIPLRTLGPVAFRVHEAKLTASLGLQVTLEDDDLNQADEFFKDGGLSSVTLPGTGRQRFVRMTLQVLPPQRWWNKILALGRQPKAVLRSPTVEADDVTWPTLEVARMESLSREIPTRKEKPPSVFLWVVDTLRADHLGPYGYSRDTSPNLDTLAREAVVFTGAVAQSSWTRPSVASILTGKYVRNHGILTVDDALSKEVPTLAESLSSLGYRTAGWITNANIGGVGLGRGFSLYQRPRPFGRYRRHYTGHVPTGAALKWIDDQPAGDPLFGYLHVSDPHAPYLPSSDFRNYWPVQDRSVGDMESVKNLPSKEDPPLSDLMALYDAEIRQVDDALGQFIAGLKERGLYQDSLIVVTADHGEEFTDHGGWQHGQTLYAEQLRVPFVIKWPQGISPFEPGSRMSAPVSHVDIPATISAVAGASSPSLDGFAISERTIANSLTLVEIGTAQAVVTSSMKLIIDHKREQVLLYDRINDPVDQVNLAPLRPRTLEYHFRLLQLLMERGSSQVAEQAQQDEETLEQLRVLGYIE